jgi:hypothetical protein
MLVIFERRGATAIASALAVGLGEGRGGEEERVSETGYSHTSTC